jgi:hypothetical protein
LSVALIDCWEQERRLFFVTTRIFVFYGELSAGNRFTAGETKTYANAAPRLKYRGLAMRLVSLKQL